LLLVRVANENGMSAS